jgi:hypothetical protein
MKLGTASATGASQEFVNIPLWTASASGLDVCLWIYETVIGFEATVFTLNVKRFISHLLIFQAIKRITVPNT